MTNAVIGRVDPPALVLVNGPPGAGKSTVAALLAERRPGAVELDIDAVKHSLDAWPDDPLAAGLEARRLILATAEGHLREGRDVVIGQYLARPDFIDELAGLARTCGVTFVEILLTLDPDELAERIAQRRAHPDRPEHAVNNDLVRPDDAPALITSLGEIARRPSTVVIDASGSVTSVVDAVERVIPRRWRLWSDVAELFDGPGDPDWDTDRERVDVALKDPWAR